jgi:hypothetical protein
LTVALDRNKGVGLRQQELLGWVKRVREVPHYLRGGPDG